MRISRLIIVGTLTFGPIGAAGAFSQEPAPVAVDQTLAAYASTKDSAHLPDGRIIHLVCMGKGSPTVILSAGAGNWGVIWNKVQPAVARKTRVCAWDRAGFGLSDGSPKPQTIDNTTTDLEDALRAGHIDGPYVAVGHSLGGLETLLLADRQPRNVVGMVLVDPTTPDQVGDFKRLPPAAGASLPDPPNVAFFRKCAAGLRAGTVRAGADPDGCLRGQTFPPDYPPELRAALDKHSANLPPEKVAKAFEFMAGFFSSQFLQEDTRIASKPDRNYGRMPLIVLTSSEFPPPPPGQPGPTKAQVMAEFAHEHGQIAALSTRGVDRVVEGSSHFIQQIKPQVVIDSIDEVVDGARADVAKSRK